MTTAKDILHRFYFIPEFIIFNIKLVSFQAKQMKHVSEGVFPQEDAWCDENAKMQLHQVILSISSGRTDTSTIPVLYFNYGKIGQEIEENQAAVKKLYFINRDEWRAWLTANHDVEKEVWLVYNKKGTDPNQTQPGAQTNPSDQERKPDP
jgi:hypothetical protein